MNSFGQHLKKFLVENVRDYAMFVALIAIMIVFEVLSGGTFLSPDNITNLINQTGYLAVLSIGVTLVIVIRHIDLSIGFLSGFLGAVAANLMMFYHFNAFTAILVVLLLGALAGLLNGSMVAYLGIPSFIATLAGWMAYRGALLLATRGMGTIIIKNETFNAIGNGYIPDIPGVVVQKRAVTNSPQLVKMVPKSTAGKPLQTLFRTQRLKRQSKPMSLW